MCELPRYDNDGPHFLNPSRGESFDDEDDDEDEYVAATDHAASLIISERGIRPHAKSSVIVSKRSMRPQSGHRARQAYRERRPILYKS